VVELTTGEREREREREKVTVKWKLTLHPGAPWEISGNSASLCTTAVIRPHLHDPGPRLGRGQNEAGRERERERERAGHTSHILYLNHGDGS